MKRIILTIAAIFTLSLTLFSCEPDELPTQTNTEIVKETGVHWDYEDINKTYYGPFNIQSNLGIYNDNGTYLLYLDGVPRPVKFTHTITKNGIKYFTYQLFVEINGSHYYTIYKQYGQYFLMFNGPGMNGYPDQAQVYPLN